MSPTMGGLCGEKQYDFQRKRKPESNLNAMIWLAGSHFRNGDERTKPECEETALLGSRLLAQPRKE